MPFEVVLVVANKTSSGAELIDAPAREGPATANHLFIAVVPQGTARPRRARGARTAGRMLDRLRGAGLVIQA